MKSNLKSPNHLIPRSPMSQSSTHTSPINRQHSSEMEQQSRNGNRMMANGNLMYRNKGDENDGGGMAMGNMWNYSQQQHQQHQQQQQSNAGGAPVFQLDTSQVAKDNFIRSDSILTSNTDDEFAYDSLIGTGKYGPIGIKNNSTAMESRQWSGLQSLPSKRYDNLDAAAVGSSDAMKLIGNFNYTMDMTKKLNEDSMKASNINNNNNRSNGGQHNNFLDLNVGDIAVSIFCTLVCLLARRRH